jgi:hypothetical protein
LSLLSGNPEKKKKKGQAVGGCIILKLILERYHGSIMDRIGLVHDKDK